MPWLGPPSDIIKVPGEEVTIQLCLSLTLSEACIGMGGGDFDWTPTGAVYMYLAGEGKGRSNDAYLGAGAYCHGGCVLVVGRQVGLWVLGIETFFPFLFMDPEALSGHLLLVGPLCFWLSVNGTPTRPAGITSGRTRASFDRGWRHGGPQGGKVVPVAGRPTRRGVRATAPLLTRRAVPQSTA